MREAACLAHRLMAAVIAAMRATGKRASTGLIFGGECGHLLFRDEIRFTAQGEIAEKRNPLASALTEMLVNPAEWRRAGSVEGSMGTSVS
jgi:hypothetical protein